MQCSQCIPFDTIGEISAQADDSYKIPMAISSFSHMFHLLHSSLSTGKRYPPFEQLAPEAPNCTIMRTVFGLITS